MHRYTHYQPAVHGSRPLGREERLHLRDGEDLLVPVPPPQSGQVIHHRLRQEEAIHVGGHRGTNVALAHLRAVRIQDERNVGVVRGMHPKRLEERDMLGKAAEGARSA